LRAQIGSVKGDFPTGEGCNDAFAFGTDCQPVLHSVALFRTSRATGVEHRHRRGWRQRDDCLRSRDLQAHGRWSGITDVNASPRSFAVSIDTRKDRIATGHRECQTRKGHDLWSRTTSRANNPRDSEVGEPQYRHAPPSPADLGPVHSPSIARTGDASCALPPSSRQFRDCSKTPLRQANVCVLGFNAEDNMQLPDFGRNSFRATSRPPPTARSEESHERWDPCRRQHGHQAVVPAPSRPTRICLLAWIVGTVVPGRIGSGEREGSWAVNGKSGWWQTVALRSGRW